MYPTNNDNQQGQNQAESAESTSQMMEIPVTNANDCCLATPPSTLLGRTMSASAVDYRGATWRSKKTTNSGEKCKDQSLPFSGSDPQSILSRIAGTKRKYSSQEDGSRLPTFINSLPSNMANCPQMLRPLAGIGAVPSPPEFITPSQPKKQLSRPNSPSNVVGRPVLPRGRVASIRRESDCSTENEAAHEKMVKNSQQVSVGFEDFCLDDKLFEERKRAKSLTEPISVFTNAFLPQSSSPSPTRANVDQCYSPSTQQVVRSNISYSPSPSPTPGSPYNRMRSMSPIAVRQISKRRYTGGANGNGGNGSGLESDGESSSAGSLTAPPSKRQCTTPRSTANASPLVRESTSSNTQHLQQHFTVSSLAEGAPISSSSSVSAELFVAASPVNSNASSSSLGASPAAQQVALGNRPRLLVDPKLAACFSSSTLDACQEEEDSSVTAEEDGPLMSSFCSAYDANSSTTFSSRANTPHSEMLDTSGAENEIPPLLLPPNPQPSSDDVAQEEMEENSAMEKPKSE